MHIGDPEDLKTLEGFADAYADSCLRNRLNHKSFIGPEDKFIFTCKRTNACCKNFSSNDRIIIDPYDVLRLSRRLGISTGRFMENYAELTLDEYTHFPVALLRYKGSNSRNKCYFLRSYGCSVYEDRPLRCRLYPLGRILNGGTSYFIYINNCLCEGSPDDRSWSAQEWINVSGAEEYLEYQEVINDAYLSADLNAYQNLDRDTKLILARTVFDLDHLFEKNSSISGPMSDKEIIRTLRNRIEDFFIMYKCQKKGRENPAVCLI